MITNFDIYTAELTSKEVQLILPAVYRILENCIGESEAITNSQIVRRLEYSGHFTTAPRVRKIIHLLRTSGDLVRLVATSKGYYRELNNEKFSRYINSLMERISAIEHLKDSMEMQRFSTL